MFYSHEILTSRKYGVATIWLVATLGARSSHSKKLTRKAITDVDVAKACGTIMEPEAPMALRLQSNLMYGVAKVYSQQCSYVLSDAQAAQTAMRALLKGAGNNLDLSLGKAKPEQLMLLDDPAFLPDMALPPLELDILRMSLEPDSQRSSQSMMSIRGRSNSVSSHTNSLPPLNLGSSSGNSVGYGLPFDDPFAAGSAQKPYTGNDGAVFGEEAMYEDEVFNFDPEGNLIDIPSPARRPQPHLGSDSAASARVRGEHEGGYVLPVHDGEGDFNMYNYGDDDLQLPDAEPFPEGAYMTGGLGGNDQALPVLGNDRIHSSPFQSSDPSTITADAPLAKSKKPKAKKTLGIDPVIELRNSALAAFRDEYIENMAAASLVKINHRAAIAAKKNAFHFVYGTGLLGVGEGLGSLKFSHPLNIFAGDSLLSKITGKPIPTTLSKKSKRALDGEEQEQQQTPKRIRSDDEVGRGFQDEDVQMNFEDGFEHEHSVELGRNAGSALQDYPSSALMPWNVSASLRGSKTGSVARRLTSASPLIGRGSALPGDIEQFSLMPEDDEVMYGRDDEEFGSPLGGGSNGNAASSSHAHGFESQQGDEFEIFGPAANVDTQTAGTSQWVRQALDKESNNFFEYVRNTIDEKTVAGDEMEMGDEGNAKGGFVTFEELFAVERNSCVVAAQAFYHVLCLATKRRVWVQQDGVEEGELGGEIRIGVVEVEVV